MKPTTPHEYSNKVAVNKASGLLGLADKGDALITRAIEAHKTPEGRRKTVRNLAIVATAVALGIAFGPAIIDRANGPEYYGTTLVPIVQYGQEGAVDMTGVAQSVDGSEQVPTDWIADHIEGMPQNKEVLADNKLDPGEVVVTPERVEP